MEFVGGYNLKKLGMFLLILLLCISLSGCSELAKLVSDMNSEDNPLSGKNTDERIIMCLQQTYPEHTFSIVTPFDKDADCGEYSDENGVKFNVSRIIYNNTYHFACSDDYLKTLLEEQGYIERITEITEKYHLRLRYDDVNETVGLAADEENTISEYAAAISEILNSVDVPRVKLPEEQGFSTGEVNYYTLPNWGMLLCRCEADNNASNEIFSFDDVNLTQQEIEQRLDTCYKRIQE